MRFLHIADLHIGKIIYGSSMIETGDQKHWIQGFLSLCDKEKPDAVLIAGDVYDRSAPGGDAVELLDSFLTELSVRNIPVLMIAGNHDSGQRLSFGRNLLCTNGIHISGVLKKEMDHVTLKDEYGPVTFWLLPYMFPEEVSVLLEDESIRTYDNAIRRYLEEQPIDFTQRNVILSHQNITADGKEAERGGSETMVGGVGQIDYTAFDGFEYAALGHIHSSYSVGRKGVRYSGTPLCYHFEETRQADKGPLLVEVKEKGEEISVDRKRIEPLHKMRALKGTRDEIYALLKTDTGRNEYFGIILTDQRITPETDSYLRSLLRSRGSVLMELKSDYSSFSTAQTSANAEAVREKPLEALFADLYSEQNGMVPPDDEEYAVMQMIGELVRQQDSHLPMDPKMTDKVLEMVRKTGGNEE